MSHRSRSVAILRPFYLSDSGSFAECKHLLACGSGEQMNDACDNSGPSGLMAGAESGPVIAVKVFIEQEQLPPMGIFLKLPGSSVNWPASVRISHEDTCQPPRKLLSNFVQCHLPAGASGTFHPEIVSIVG